MPPIEKCGRLWLAIVLLLAPSGMVGDTIAAHHKEGPSHGFLVVRTMDGKAIASGDLIQTAKPGGRIVSRLVFHFKDGSIQDETTEFSQKDKFQLLRDH